MSTTHGLIGKSVKELKTDVSSQGMEVYRRYYFTRADLCKFVRSPYAHAKILSVDTNAAASMPGVVAIFTGADVENVNGVPGGWQVNFKMATT